MLIKDNGKIRECPANKVKLGFWKSFFLFYGYKRLFESVEWKKLLQSIRLLFELFIFILVFPVLPFIQCYNDWVRAKKLIEQEKRIDKLHE